MNSSGRIEVAAGVLQRSDGSVLVAERPPGKPLAGYFEFPGGKIESGESPAVALARELHEELGIGDIHAEPLIRLQYSYPDRRVRLWVYRVANWSGEPADREGQRLAWLAPDCLNTVPLLPANRPVVCSLRLPSRVLVTPPPAEPFSEFLRLLEHALTAGLAHAVILRLAQQPLTPSLAARVAAIAAKASVPVLLNGGHETCLPAGFAGRHLPAAALLALDQRPATPGWLGASVHSVEEARHAWRIGVDYVLVGNVRATPSHPGRKPLGWQGFEEVSAAAGLPTYAIGGVGPADMTEARRRWGKGIAAIRAFWPTNIV